MMTLRWQESYEEKEDLLQPVKRVFQSTVKKEKDGPCLLSQVYATYAVLYKLRESLETRHWLLLAGTPLCLRTATGMQVKR